MLKFVSDLRHVSGFLRVLRFPQPIQLTADIAEILLNWPIQPIGDIAEILLNWPIQPTADIGEILLNWC